MTRGIIGKDGRYRHHKYKWARPFGISVNHHWELVAPSGALHFHVSITDEYGPSAGLEVHSCVPIEGRAPDHIDCWLTGGRCWHDGTSMYALEHLWPRIEPYLRTGDHEHIFLILEREADERFGFDGDTP